uniref:SMP-30/Gluconolactonase/LRE-like region domain-containing protein n=1 Tax=viral metagenome TaxID=1070528 RepID=A0A6C0KUC7_9ZZZZ
MLTKKTKKIIYFSILNVLGLLFAYWLFTLKTPILAASKENFTSVSSGVMSNSNNVWAICNVGSKANENGGSKNLYSNSYLSKMNFSDSKNLSVVTNFPIFSQSNIQNVLPLGSNVWVSDYDNAAVRIINSTSGSIIQNVSVGRAPIGMAFDGTNVWVCNYSDSTCTVISEGDGSIISTTPIGDGPFCVLFDSQYIWISCVNGEVFVINPSSFSLKNKFSPGGQLTRMTCLNNSVYVLCTNQGSNVGLYSLIKMGSDQIQNTINLTNSSGSQDIYVDVTNDGKNIYVLSVGGNVLCVQSDGTYVREFAVGLQGSFINILGGNVFVLDATNNKVAVYSTFGKNIVSSLPTIVSA